MNARTPTPERSATSSRAGTQLAGPASSDAGANAAGELLALWERGVAAAPAERDDALLTGWLRGAPPASLGARNAVLLSLRARLLGSRQLLHGNCPDCGAVAEFTIDCAALCEALQPAPGAAGPQRLELDGHRIDFHVPEIDDLRAAARATETDAQFVTALLERCVTRCERSDGSSYAPNALPAAVAERLSQCMEALEPGASVSFDLSCPQCPTRWAAAMDVGDVVWRELQSRAERLLLDVAALARAYGWSETQVLALSPTRRAAYLQLVGAP